MESGEGVKKICIEANKRRGWRLDQTMKGGLREGEGL